MKRKDTAAVARFLHCPRSRKLLPIEDFVTSLMLSHLHEVASGGTVFRFPSTALTLQGLSDVLSEPGTKAHVEDMEGGFDIDMEDSIVPSRPVGVPGIASPMVYLTVVDGKPSKKRRVQVLSDLLK